MYYAHNVGNHSEKEYNMEIHGVLHVGAHECEELTDYHKQGISDDNIIWVDALIEKVEQSKQKHPNSHIYQAVVHDTDDHENPTTGHLLQNS